MRAPADPGIAALLVRALEAHARGSGVEMTVAEVRSRRWCSATFEGERCTVLLRYTRQPIGWLDALPEADLPIRRHFLADLRVVTASDGEAELEALVLLAA